MDPQSPHPASNPYPGAPEPIHPNPSHRSHNHKNMVISLVVAGVLLIGSIGIAMWLLTGSDNANEVGDSASKVTADKTTVAVSFVEPDKIPANYIKRDQSTPGSTTAYYYDNGTGCVVITTTLKLGGQYGSTAKEAIANSTKTAESIGVTTAKSKDGPSLALKDSKTNKTYTFDSLELEQDVNVEGISSKKQNNIIAYKQFGVYVASVGYSCKADIWNAKKTELLNIASSFKVKIEK